MTIYFKEPEPEKPAREFDIGNGHVSFFQVLMNGRKLLGSAVDTDEEYIPVRIGSLAV